MWQQVAMGLTPAIEATASFLALYWLLTCVHEGFHIAAACLVGHAGAALTVSNLVSAAFSKHVSVRGASGWQRRVIQHAGWVGSCVLVAVILLCTTAEGGSSFLQAAAILTALDAVCSDLLGIASGTDMFHCGNFGLVVLNKEHRDKVLKILKEMIRITMMRGAQSGGVITYAQKSGLGFKGVRSRVVNGKRTDLSELIVSKLQGDLRLAPLLEGPRVYAGHTRFATTSKATFDGTHPHQWTPPETLSVWRRSPDSAWTRKSESVENFICHNGDLDGDLTCACVCVRACVRARACVCVRACVHGCVRTRTRELAYAHMRWRPRAPGTVLACTAHTHVRASTIEMLMYHISLRGGCGDAPAGGLDAVAGAHPP